MYTCTLKTAEGIKLRRRAPSRQKAAGLPVVIDICGIPCRQREVHKEADRCTVRRGSVAVCKTGGAGTHKLAKSIRKDGWLWNKQLHSVFVPGH